MYNANESRYDTMTYRRCGRSGIQIPEISLGLWHNFGEAATVENARDMLTAAFDLGITHFDIANNYGPPPGSAEIMFGRIMRSDLAPYRDEMIISSKAGYLMWPGPYGEWGSRKYLIASCDASLKRTGLAYFDIFYHHRPDPDTPLIETMSALDWIVRSGKALYAGISNYGPDEAAEAFKILRELGTPCLIHQPKYSMLFREPENGLLDVCERAGAGVICFSPLAGGRLTDRYLGGIPKDSRAAGGSPFLSSGQITPALLSALSKLSDIASERGQTLAQMALSWTLRHSAVTSALIGASSKSQIEDCAKAAGFAKFSGEELHKIDEIIRTVSD
ncbi:MAG: aldo/keto reductase [Oscillospiraceae bacterium]|nr:aldo/keto reductase [Oscillospiraceae bacterium]